MEAKDKGTIQIPGLSNIPILERFLGGQMRRDILSNLLWRFAERSGAQGVAFIVSIILARMLAPEIYGTIALVTVFINILNVFVDSGLGNALIQKRDADDLDFSTVFYFNMLICCVLYACIFFLTPVIARFYENESLTSVTRVLSLTLVISGVKNVQQAYVSRTLQFRRFFFATLGGTIGAVIIGITIAYRGGGVWALVLQQVFSVALNTLILWITVKWRPKKTFSFERLRGLFSFGWKLLLSALIDTLYNELRQLIIGKLYTPSDLGFYNQGQKFPSFIVTNINSSIDSVLFPTMSNIQDNRARVKSMTRRSIKISTYIMAPMMMGLAFCAKPLVSLILTDKWLPCIPFLRIFCITYMFYPIHTANLNAIKAMGRSDLFLKLEILKKTIGVSLLLLTIRFGVEAMAYSLLISSVFSQIINAWPNRQLLDYGYIEQLKDIIPSIILAVIMGLVISLFALLNLSNIATLVLQVFAGVVIYVYGSSMLKIDSFKYLYDMMTNRKHFKEV